jgi:hypothetical protein
MEQTKPAPWPPRAKRKPLPDRLPPHAPEAERGVLGCCLAGPTTTGEAAKFFAGVQPFYDLRHAAIWDALQAVYEKNGTVDLITLQQQLADANLLEEVGGIGELAAMADGVPSAANLPHYARIVLDKYLERKFIAATVQGTAQVFEGGAALLPTLSRLKDEMERIENTAARQGGTMPPRLKTLDAFADDYINAFWGVDADEPGWKLPFEFPFKIRGGEMTMFTAENGSGKSTLLSYILLHLLNQRQRVVVASMETRPAITIKMLAAQLIGQWSVPDSTWGRTTVLAAYQWLKERVLIYDFLGIADWRDLLYTFEFAAQQGYTVFGLDSIMRLGIPDDDYAEQGFAAKQMAQFCIARNAHLFALNHLNKGDGDLKRKSRGSAQWADNVANIVSVTRNSEKQQEKDKLWEERRNGQIDETEYNLKAFALKDKYDCYFDLAKQRWPGSRQNGRRYLFFNSDSLQFHAQPQTPSVNWLERWVLSDGHRKDNHG